MRNSVTKPHGHIGNSIPNEIKESTDVQFEISFELLVKSCMFNFLAQ